MLHILGIAAAAVFLIYNVRHVNGAFIARRFTQTGDGTTAIIGLARVIVVHVFTYWVAGSWWAIGAAGVMVVAGWSPWTEREYKVGPNEPVEFGQETPIPVEVGDSEYAGAPVLDQSEREAFDDLVRGLDA